MDKASAATTAQRPALYRRHPWLVPGGLLLLLAFLTVNVRTGGPTVSMDRWIRGIVQSHANLVSWKWIKDRPFAPARVLIELGNVRVAAPILAFAAIVAALWLRVWRPLFTAAAGIVLLLGVVTAAKILIARPNPGHSGLNGHLLGAFPSGHTTAACMCYVLTASLLAPARAARARRIALVSTSVLGFLVGLALVWCDLHWFTDVLAGWALSGILVPLAAKLTGWKAGPGRSSGKRPAGSLASPDAAQGSQNGDDDGVQDDEHAGQASDERTEDDLPDVIPSTRTR